MSNGHADFFTRLESDLRGAASRPDRAWPARIAGPRRAVVAVAIAAALALVAVPLAVVLGGDDRAAAPAGDAPPAAGTIIDRDGERRMVVATGTSPVGGPWQLEAYVSRRLTDPKTGEEYQPAGLPCLNVVLRDEAISHGVGGSGACGEFPQTPGFARIQHSLPNTAGAGPVREVLVYGRVPREASAVVITVDGEVRERVRPFEGPAGQSTDFYLVAIPPELTQGRVNWLDREGREGSRGIALMSP